MKKFHSVHSWLVLLALTSASFAFASGKKPHAPPAHPDWEREISALEAFPFLCTWVDETVNQQFPAHPTEAEKAFFALAKSRIPRDRYVVQHVEDYCTHKLMEASTATLNRGTVADPGVIPVGPMDAGQPTAAADRFNGVYRPTGGRAALADSYLKLPEPPSPEGGRASLVSDEGVTQ